MYKPTSMIRKSLISSFVGSVIALQAASAEEIVVATVGNADMLNMRELSTHFLQKNPGITITWEVVDESVLRLMQSRDSKRDAPRYDVYTLGLLEAPLWGGNGRLSPVPDSILNSGDSNDWIPEIMEGFRSGDSYYALPFYGESSITYYRRDVFRRYGVTMPQAPTWSDIDTMLDELASRSNGQAGTICLRGKAGWGENMALFSTMVNAFGGRWFDQQWSTTLTEEPWFNAINFYLNLMDEHGLPAAWNNGYSENLQAFRSGECDIWVDSTAAGGSIASAEFYSDVGYAKAPSQVTEQGSNWLWSWGFAVPANSLRKDAAWRFVQWATSNEYHRLVEQKYGIAKVPPGTRHSLYQNRAYQQYATFADWTINAIRETDFEHASIQPVPYRGVQFIQTEEFQQIGNYVGKILAGMLQSRLQDEPIDLERELERASEFVRASHNVGNYLREHEIDTF